MPRRLTMATLRTRCQQRCDKESDLSIGTSEWNTLISEAYGEAHSLVCESGLRYFETTTTVTATGAASYSEPVDILSIVGVDYLIDGTTTGRRRTLRMIPAQYRARFAGSVGTDAGFYAFVDDQLFLYPNPSSGTYQVLYVPQSPDLSSYADSDLVDVVCPAGEAFVIWAVAVKAMAKSDDDTTLAEREREAARQRLADWANLRAINEPQKRIVQTNDDEWATGFDFNYGFGGWPW